MYTSQRLMTFHEVFVVIKMLVLLGWMESFITVYNDEFKLLYPIAHEDQIVYSLTFSKSINLH